MYAGRVSLFVGVALTFIVATMPLIGKCDSTYTYRNIRFDDASVLDDWDLSESGVRFNCSTDGSSGNVDIPALSTVAKCGTKSLRFKHNPTTATGYQRSEMVLWETSINKEYWSGFSVRRDYDDVPALWTSIHQWWQDTETPQCPPLALYVKPNTHSLIFTYVNDNQWVDIDAGDFSKTSWSDFVVKWKIAPTGNAALRLYKNGELLADLYGANCKIGYTATNGGKNWIQEKFGLYRGNQNTTAAIYYDQVRVGAHYNYVRPDVDDSTWIGGDWVGYWKFDRDDGYTYEPDSSAHANPATMTDYNTYGIKEPGVLGNAAVFDGVNDRAVIPTKDVTLKYLGGGKGLTIAFWMKIDPDEVNGGYIVSKPFNDNGEYNYTVRLTADRQIGVWLAPQGSSGSFDHVFTEKVFNLDQWYFVGIRIESSRRISFFVNGVYQKDVYHNITDFTPSHGDKDTSLCIGSLYPYASGWTGNQAFSFMGAIDEVRIWDRVLLTPDFAAIHDAEKP